ncbi:hypothetical protein ACIRCZ_18685 [Leifsonia sp. NPDC102414]|uniref:hypothetical protein n=1 Tax=Leifsonia sp. NPDC102414 TaxID=3364124 RepID=UPI0037F259DA
MQTFGQTDTIVAFMAGLLVLLILLLTYGWIWESRQRKKRQAGTIHHPIAHRGRRRAKPSGRRAKRAGRRAATH